jgi:phosphatidate phosphatase PAH1
MLSLLLACASAPLDSPAGPCLSYRGVVTDIDETLTTSDEEWLSQMSDAGHDPAMRPDAEALMNAYAEQGYGVFYVTARGQDFTMSDDRTATQATVDWLLAHGFPVDEERVFLSEGFGVAGEAAATYKTEVLEQLADEGWTMDQAYGNAESDIQAFQTALPDEQIFLVGELAGTLGVQPIPDEDAYTTHLAAQAPLILPTDCVE